MSFYKNEIEAVLVYGTSTSKKQVNREEVNNFWQPCPVPELLGVPLKYKLYEKRTTEDFSEESAIFMLVQPDNGLADIFWQYAGCGLLGFARSDGRDFTRVLFWQLHDYIFSLMYYYGLENGAEQAIKKMNPRDFLDYTNTTLEKSLVFRQSENEKPRGQREEVCARCGKQNARYHCSLCKKAFYCQVGCQRADWPQHKQTCKSSSKNEK